MMRLMMNSLRSLPVVLFALVALPVFGGEKEVVKPKAKLPTVEVAEIRKQGKNKDGSVRMQETILRISNPTDRTFYVRGAGMRALYYEMEIKRGEKWFTADIPECGVGLKNVAFRPGAATLISVNRAWKEEASRFRIRFSTKEKWEDDTWFSVLSRVIERKELGDAPDGSAGYNEPGIFSEAMTDEESKKKREEDLEASRKADAEWKAKKAMEEAEKKVMEEMRKVEEKR